MSREVVGPGRVVDRLKSQASDYLQGEGYPAAWPEFLSLLDNSALPQDIAQALRVLFRAHTTNGQIVAGNAVGAAQEMALLMQAAHNMNWLANLPDLERGRKTICGARKGHEAVHGTKEARERRQIEYQRAMDDLKAKNRRLSRTARARSVAKVFCVSPKTILRYTH